MERKYDIQAILSSAIGVKSIPKFNVPVFENTKDKFDNNLSALQKKQKTINGTNLYQKGVNGIWYFMPVILEYRGKSFEMHNAVIGITGDKTFVETALVGKNGKVKELISTNDYEITIAAFIQSDDGTYPYEKLKELKELYDINESLKIVSVLTDTALEDSKNIVIKKIEYLSMQYIEDGQSIKLTCTSDKEFELILD